MDYARLTVDMDKKLHKKLKRLAVERSISMRQFVCELIEKALVIEERKIENGDTKNS